MPIDFPNSPFLNQVFYETTSGRSWLWDGEKWLSYSDINSRGPKGGLFYTFSTTLTDSDPGNGVFRFNNTILASVNRMYIDLVDGDGVDQTAFITSWDASTNPIKGTLVIQSRTSGSSVSTWNITGFATTPTGYRRVVVSYVSGVLPANNEPCVIQFSRAGNVGATGATGSPGPGSYPDTYIRSGTGAITLPAVNSFVTVRYDTPLAPLLNQFDNINVNASFPDIGWRGVVLTISNGDPGANPARLEVLSEGYESFRVYHTGGGNIGAHCRFNLHAYAYF